MSWGIAFRLRQQLKGSLYALPVLGALLGPVLGQLTLWLDGSVQLPEAWSYSAATATAVLSVLVGSMVALLGFVVTIGVLVVQMATGTLSPRYMRLWYRDLLQKVVLATLAGTLTFSFSLLRHVEDTSVPTVDGRRERPPGHRRPPPGHAPAEPAASSHREDAAARLPGLDDGPGGEVRDRPGVRAGR
jgi:hypothetical protein